MPFFQVELSDGRKFKVEADSQPSEQDIFDFIGSGGGEAEPNADRGYLTQLSDALGTGYNQMSAGVKGTFNAVTGDQQDLGVALADYANAAKEQQQLETPEDRALAAGFAKNAAEWKAARGIIPTAEAAGGYISTIAQHPFAAFKQGVQSAPNALVSLGTEVAGRAGGAALGALGTAETGPGAILGGIAGWVGGGVLANTLMEAGPAIYDILDEKTGGNAANMTAEQITAALKADPTIAEEGLKRGAIRGATIGAIESLGLKGAGRLASVPERAAARAAQDTLIAAGVDVADKLAVEAAMANPATKELVRAAAEKATAEFSKLGNAARWAGAAGIETASEGAGEYGAQVAAGQETSPTDVVQEMMGGPAMAAISTPVAKSMELAGSLLPKTDANGTPIAPEPEAPLPDITAADIPDIGAQQRADEQAVLDEIKRQAQAARDASNPAVQAAAMAVDAASTPEAQELAPETAATVAALAEDQLPEILATQDAQDLQEAMALPIEPEPVTTQENATQTQPVEESRQPEYPNGNGGRQAPETGGGNRPVSPAPSEVQGQEITPAAQPEVGVKATAIGSPVSFMEEGKQQEGVVNAFSADGRIAYVTTEKSKRQPVRVGNLTPLAPPPVSNKKAAEVTNSEQAKSPELMTPVEFWAQTPSPVEVDHRKIKLKKSVGFALNNGKMPLTQLVDAPELFDKYPALKDSTIEVRPTDHKTGGWWDFDSKNIVVAPAHEILFQRTIAHELQHAVDTILGRPPTEENTTVLDKFQSNGRFTASVTQRSHLEESISAKRPVNAEAVEESGIKLPSGYVKEGDLYVYKPQPLPPNIRSASVANGKASTDDSAYLAAVNSGDLATAQRMVDEAAKSAGYDTDAFHGTIAEDFTQFSTGRKRLGRIWGNGFYLTESRKDAEQWAEKAERKSGWGDKRVLATKIKLQKPLVLEGEGSVANMAEMLPPEFVREVRPLLERDGEDELASIINGDTYIESFEWEKPAKAIAEYAKELGYDGITGTYDGVQHYVAFDPNQIKSAEPVTRDSEGNVIPLSQRFNQGSDDIRYSKRKGEPNTEFRSEADYQRELTRTLGITNFSNVVFGNYAPLANGISLRGYVAQDGKVHLNLATLRSPEDMVDTFNEEATHTIWEDAAVADAWARLRELVPQDQLDKLRAKFDRLGYAEGVWDEEAFNEIARTKGFEWLNRSEFRKLWDAIKAAVRRIFGLADNQEISRVSAHLLSYAIEHQQSMTVDTAAGGESRTSSPFRMSIAPPDEELARQEAFMSSNPHVPGSDAAKAASKAGEKMEESQARFVQPLPLGTQYVEYTNKESVADADAFLTTMADKDGKIDLLKLFNAIKADELPPKVQRGSAPYQIITAELTYRIGQATEKETNPYIQAELDQMLVQAGKFFNQIGTIQAQGLQARVQANAILRKFAPLLAVKEALVERIDKIAKTRFKKDPGAEGGPIEEINKKSKGKAGKRVSKAVKDETEDEADAEEELNKAQKTAEKIIGEIAETHADPMGWKAKGQPDPVRALYYAHLKAPMEEATFVSAAVALGVDAPLATQLWGTAKLEISARAAIREEAARQRGEKDAERQIKIAENTASRLIYRTEERLRQGSKDLSKSTDGDSINRAFREQVEKAMSWDAFRDRLAKLKVGEVVAARLFRTAEREALDQQAMADYRAAREARKKTDSLLAKDSPALAKLLNDLRKKMFPGMDWTEIFTDLPDQQQKRQQAIADRLVKHEALRDLTRDEFHQLTIELDKAWQRERQKVFLEELEKAGVEGLGAKAPVDVQKIKNSLPRIIRALNLGLFNSDAFKAAIAPEYGLRQMTQAESNKLRDLGQKAYDAPEGQQRNRILQQLMDEMRSITGVSRWQLLESYWVASVLSGTRTQFDTFAAILNGAATVARLGGMRAVTGHPREGATIVAEFLRGLGEAVGEAAQILRTGDRSYLKRTGDELAGQLEGSDKGFHMNFSQKMLKEGNLWQKFPALVMEAVSRSMAAADHLNNTATSRGAIAAARAMYPEIYKGALTFTPEERADARKRAIMEYLGGVEPKTQKERADITKRTRELLYGELDPKAILEGNEIGDIAAYQNDPTGLAGMVYKMMQMSFGYAEKKARSAAEDEELNILFRTIAGFAAVSTRSLLGVRFARFGLNFASNSISLIPGTYFAKTPLYGKNLSKTRDSLIFANNLIGLAGMLGIYAFFSAQGDDDDSVWIDGPWSGLDIGKQRERRSAGHEPLSIGWRGKDGKIHRISYRQWELGSLLAAVGSMMDKKRFFPEKWNKESLAAHIFGAVGSGAVHVKDLSALSTLTDLLGKSAYASDPGEDMGKKLNKLAAGWSMGLIPNTFKDIDQWTDSKYYKPSTNLGQWMKGIPILRRQVEGGRPMLTILGDPVKLDRSPWSRVYTNTPQDASYEALGALQSRGIWLPQPSTARKIVNAAGDKVPLSTLGPEKEWQFQKLVGQRYKTYLAETAADFAAMDREDVEKQIANDTARIRDDVATEIEDTLQ